MKYIPNPFPVSARLFLDGEAAKRGLLLPDVLTKDRVLLLDSTTDASLVATCELYGENKAATGTAQNRTGTTGNGTGTTGNTGGTVVEIPVSQDILVSFLSKDSQGSTSDSLTTLHTKTIALWKSLLSPAGSEKATTLSRLSCPGEDPAQHKLFTMVLRGRERECQAIKAPPQLHKHLFPTDKNSGSARTYQPLSNETETESQYMAISSSLASSSDYDDADSDIMEDDPFTSDHEQKVKVLQQM